jgi:hypothetical protein
MKLDSRILDAAVRYPPFRDVIDNIARAMTLSIVRYGNIECGARAKF